MADDLHDALTEIDGIGAARADEIIDVLDEAGSADGDVADLLEEAIDHFDDSEYADVTAQQGFSRVRKAYAQLTSE